MDDVHKWLRDREDQARRVNRNIPRSPRDEKSKHLIKEKVTVF